MLKPFFSTSLTAAALLLLSQTAFSVELPKLSPDPKDPQYQKKGEFERTYTFPGTDEKIPYHMFVPSKWNKNTKMPLVVVLHGGGQTADKPFERGNGILAKTAEQRGFVLVGVLGYRNYAGYGNPFRIVQVAPAAGGAQGKGKTGAPAAKKGGNSPEERQRSEEDVLNVLALVQKEYNTDPTRTYLMGNLMGSGGTWYLGEKYPELWAAISPSNGPVEADNYPFERLKTVPTVVVHGDLNTGTSGEAALKLVNGAQKAGVEVLWLHVPGVDHLDAWTHVVPMVFEFFAQHTKK